jgi:hypothetical protein
MSTPQYFQSHCTWNAALLALQTQVGVLQYQLALSRSESMAQRLQVAQLQEQVRVCKSGRNSTDSDQRDGTLEKKKLQAQLLQAKKEARTSKSQRDRAMDDQQRLVREKNELRNATEQAQEAYAKLERISTTRLHQTKHARAGKKLAVETLSVVEDRLAHLSQENKALTDKVAEAKLETETSRQDNTDGSKQHANSVPPSPPYSYFYGFRRETGCPKRRWSSAFP